MTERFVLTSEKIGKHWEILITDYQTDEPFDDVSYDATDNYQDTLDNMEDLCLLLNQIHDENEQLKQQLDDLRTYDKEEFIEAEQINNIYKEKGFKGVIGYAKDQLQQYGVVKEVEKGLWVMVTGGWSDNEHWIHCLNNPISMFCMKHYRGYLRGGAFYYTEKPRGDVKIRLKGDFE